MQAVSLKRDSLGYENFLSIATGSYSLSLSLMDDFRSSTTTVASETVRILISKCLQFFLLPRVLHKFVSLLSEPDFRKYGLRALVHVRDALQ